MNGVAPINPSLPDDLRAAGWAVAVHNDYRLGGVAHTLWLLTQGCFAIKGEGTTDAVALDQCREQASRLATATDAGVHPLPMSTEHGQTPEMDRPSMVIHGHIGLRCGRDEHGRQFVMLGPSRWVPIDQINHPWPWPVVAPGRIAELAQMLHDSDDFVAALRGLCDAERLALCNIGVIDRLVMPCPNGIADCDVLHFEYRLNKIGAERILDT